uniref:NADH-quinone oxidoreductase subunit D n=1 Tax=uncultured bacterium contig00001 TaxID=1181493 RepID=A0A806KQT2_9BACT|nr:NADH-ubiquinone oxidoreductase chain D [uncultured bacterium contig00001]
MVLNFGPSHPSTHGTLRVILSLEGECVVKAEPEIGYLHRGVEKLGERLSYAQFIPLTDRMNYCSAPMNNVGYALAVEKLLGIQDPPRSRVIRVLVSELARIADHLVCIGINAVDIGAFSQYLYLFHERETIYDLLEMVAGQRLHTCVTRVGGVVRDVPKEFAPLCKKFIASCSKTIDEMEAMLTRNAIWIDRTKGIGSFPAEQAISWGYTGPCLRACGVAHDLRKAQPYLDYESYDFDVPVGTSGDVYDRYLVRAEEMRQSLAIIGQCLKRLKELGKGPVMIDDYKFALPPKEKVYSRMEALMHHFKLVMHGMDTPVGEIYSATEAANGELGFYIVSDGGKSPFRIHVRPPCFPIFSSLDEKIRGGIIADLLAEMGSMNIIAGELDR